MVLTTSVSSMRAVMIDGSSIFIAILVKALINTKKKHSKTEKKAELIFLRCSRKLVDPTELSRF